MNLAWKTLCPCQHVIGAGWGRESLCSAYESTYSVLFRGSKRCEGREREREGETEKERKRMRNTESIRIDTHLSIFFSTLFSLFFFFLLMLREITLEYGYYR